MDTILHILDIIVNTEPFRAILYIVGMIIFVALNAAYLVLMERKVAGHVQLRPGPTENGPFGILQPMADGLKLMT